MAAPLSRVSLAGELPPHLGGARGVTVSPSAQTAELALVGHAVEWDSPRASGTVYARVEWPGAAYDQQHVLCIKGNAGDAVRLAVSSSKNAFARWLEDSCGAVQVAIRDASQRGLLGTCTLSLSELSPTSTHKALANLHLPIVSEGRRQGTLRMSASLSYSKVGYSFLHDPGLLRDAGPECKVPRTSSRSRGDLFQILVDCIDRSESRAQEMFSACNTYKNGTLDRHGVAAFLEKLLGERPTAAEQRFFWDMMQIDEDEAISFREFSHAARECWAAISAARGGEASGSKVQVNDVMRRLGVYILDSSGVDLASAFGEFDEDGSGTLEPSEVAAMVAALVPDLPSEDRRMLLANMSVLDSDGDGNISFEELRSALMEAVMGVMGGLSAAPAASEPLMSAGPAKMFQASSELLPPAKDYSTLPSPGESPRFRSYRSTVSRPSTAGSSRPFTADSMAHSTASKEHVLVVDYRRGSPTDSPDILVLQTPTRRMFQTPAERPGKSQRKPIAEQAPLAAESKANATPRYSPLSTSRPQSAGGAYMPSVSRTGSSRLSSVTLSSSPARHRPATDSARSESRVVASEEILTRHTYSPSYSPYSTYSTYSSLSTPSTTYDSPDPRQIMRPYRDEERMRENNKLLLKEISLMKEHLASRTKEADLLSDKLKNCHQASPGPRRGMHASPYSADHRRENTVLSRLESRLGSMLEDKKAANSRAIKAWNVFDSSLSGLSRIRMADSRA